MTADTQEDLSPSSPESSEGRQLTRQERRSAGEKLRGFDFWRSIGSPRLIAAPMVEGSELPFRRLVRRYGAELCYTPMFHAANFAHDRKYRKREFTTDGTDRPVFAQFAGHDPRVLLEAAKLIEDQVDAVDINLGCPQGIAKRGFYGSFLMDDTRLIREIVTTLDQGLNVPVTVKIRRFADLQHTLEYAQMLQDAGAAVVCVHSRTREMKGEQTGLADWEVTRAVKERLTVPVISNGNILSFADIEPCFAATGADAVMSAEALLWDPRLFSNPKQPLWTGRTFRLQGAHAQVALDISDEYLDCCEETSFEQTSIIRQHLFKLLVHSLECHTDIRDDLSNNIPQTKPMPFIRQCVRQLRVREEHKANQGYFMVRKDELQTEEQRLAKARDPLEDVDGVCDMFGA
eukprot:TRINITY_DN20227_c0_g1_i1.p1 TRINITY_DN20227_c0_g1~~TRINITY_DN20227_c0_g1_i1.p1  ORF type:complete len:403 (+),score=88.59 TRINITY_DN20227_c0_g1_i1:46-1254(+)